MASPSVRFAYLLSMKGFGILKNLSYAYGIYKNSKVGLLASYVRIQIWRYF